MKKLTLKVLTLASIVSLLSACGSKDESSKGGKGNNGSGTNQEQTTAVYDNSTPENVVKEIIRAAKEKDYSNLPKICDPENNGDKDSRTLCDLENQDEDKQKEFLDIFGTAEIIDLPEVDENDKKVKIKIKFGEDDTEKLKLVKRDSSWYLLSF